MRAWKDLIKWPLFGVYGGIEFGGETNNREAGAYEERMGKRNSICVRVCVSEWVEGPITSCDYLARSLVPGVLELSYECACGGDEMLEGL